MSKKRADRRLCTKCTLKKYTKEMYYIYLPLFNRSHWVCHDCYNMYGSSVPYVTDEERTFQEPLSQPIQD